MATGQESEVVRPASPGFLGSIFGSLSDIGAQIQPDPQEEGAELRQKLARYDEIEQLERMETLSEELEIEKSDLERDPEVKAALEEREAAETAAALGGGQPGWFQGLLGREVNVRETLVRLSRTLPKGPMKERLDRFIDQIDGKAVGAFMQRVTPVPGVQESVLDDIGEYLQPDAATSLKAIRESHIVAFAEAFSGETGIQLKDIFEERAMGFYTNIRRLESNSLATPIDDVFRPGNMRRITELQGGEDKMSVLGKREDWEEIFTPRDIKGHVRQFISSAMQLIQTRVKTNIAQENDFFAFWKMENQQFLSLIVKLVAMVHTDAQFRQQRRPMLESSFQNIWTQIDRVIRTLNKYSIVGFGTNRRIVYQQTGQQEPFAGVVRGWTNF